jgi:hypothetical protein
MEQPACACEPRIVLHNAQRLVAGLGDDLRVHLGWPLCRTPNERRDPNPRHRNQKIILTCGGAGKVRAQREHDVIDLAIITPDAADGQKPASLLS